RPGKRSGTTKARLSVCTLDEAIASPPSERGQPCPRDLRRHEPILACQRVVPPHPSPLPEERERRWQHLTLVPQRDLLARSQLLPPLGERAGVRGTVVYCLPLHPPQAAPTKASAPTRSKPMPVQSSATPHLRKNLLQPPIPPREAHPPPHR